MITNILLVGAGGFLGAIFRYILAGLVDRVCLIIPIPSGTLFVNFLGSFLVGFLFEHLSRNGVVSDHIYLFVFVGVLGSLTTFSTFTKETMHLFAEGATFLGLINVFLHILLCFIAISIGYTVGALGK